jgi:hypothetical protein
VQPRPRRSGRARLLLISAALASLLGGYYLGQYWQRQPLADLSAVVYREGRQVDFPPAAGIVADPSTDGPWRVVLVADLQDESCQALLQQWAMVRNRLAGWPGIQRRLRLTVLDYTTIATDPAQLPIAADWVELIRLEPVSLDALAGTMGILPGPQDRCRAMQANAILVAPDLRRWALLPSGQATIMAHDIAIIVQFVE